MVLNSQIRLQVVVKHGLRCIQRLHCLFQTHCENHLMRIQTTVHSGTSCLNTVTEVQLSAMIAPVYVSHVDSPHSERLVYALLDTQSEKSFILDETYNALGLRGERVELSLSTMSAEDMPVQSDKVRGLVVRGLDSDVKVKLPSVYSRSIMPANRSHIPTAQMTRNWPYLQSLNDKLMPISDCETGLLISYRCPKAFFPRNLLKPADDEDGHFALETDLGWGIIGVINRDHNDDDPIGHSHRILAYEVQGTKQPVHVAFQVQTKEVISVREVLNVLETDFRDSKQGLGLSQDDKSFLSMMESNVYQRGNDHYEMPLPFRNSSPNLVNNRSQAEKREKRLEHLKSKFKKDCS